MSNDVIPDDVQQFVLKHIDSVEDLEGLLLLRNNPNMAWSAEALAKRLYVSERQTAALLLRLSNGGFLIKTARNPLLYQYRPHSDEIRQMIDRVADIHSRCLVPITNLIHSKPVP